MTHSVTTLRHLALVAVTVTVAACDGLTNPPPLSSSSPHSVAVRPPEAQIVPGGKVAFSATATAPVALTWSVVEVGGGTVSATGVYTAPATTGVFHVVAQAGGVGASGSASVTVTNDPLVAVVVTPSILSLASGATAQFTATVAGTSDQSVTWSVAEGPAGGVVDASGLYTAPSTPGNYHVVATSNAKALTQGSALVGVSRPPGAGGRYLGVNLGWVSPSGEDQIFADILKQGRPWTDTSDRVVALGSDGWPVGNSLKIGFLESNGFPPYQATTGYKLRFRGQASVGGENVTIVNKTYDAVTNITTADVRVNSVANTWLTFTNTKRLSTDAVGTGIAEVSLMRPGHVFGADYVNRDFAAAIQPFSLLRLMQSGGPGYDLWGTLGAVGVMGNRDTTWASRQRPGAGYCYNGPAWEDWVILANLTGKDIWINIPYNVDDDYIRKLAQLLRYGSDGTSPFTSAVHDPATWTPGTTSWYPGLLPGRHVYVEFVNELWNHGWGYPSSDINTAQARADVAAGDSHHLNWDGTGNWIDDRQVAWQTVRISLLFRETWGTAMDGAGRQVRIVYPTQGDWGNWDRAESALRYIQSVWGPTSVYGSIGAFTNPKQPVGYYVYTVSGSMYLHYDNPDAPATVDEAFTALYHSLSGPVVSESNTVQQRIDYGQQRAAKYGLLFSAYESGTEIPINSVTRAAYADPRSKTLLMDAMHYFYGKAASDVWVHFWMVGDSDIAAGLSLDLRDTSTPRWQAMRDIAGGL